MLEAWCTPRQGHRFDTFSRYVFRAERRDEGYEEAELKQYFEKITAGQQDDRFMLPRDAERLRIQAAATGLQNAVLDHPAYRSDDELHTIATRICDLGQQLWQAMTNDMKQYRVLFIPAFVLGYHLGMQQLALMHPSQQKELTETVLDHQFNGNGPRSLLVFADLIRERMRVLGVESIDQLY
jgi:hypothetical protein